MRELILKITLKSPSLIGSGEGFGSIIDSDIVFDEIGIPYIPAKRIKGCLRDSAIEICEIFEMAGINILNLNKEKDSGNKYSIVSSVFGKQGSDTPSPVYFSNLTIEEYNNIKEWLAYFINKYKDLISPASITEYFTEIRQQTAIGEDGVAKAHNLRTIRVARKGLVFEGKINIESDDEEYLKLLFFACKNFRRMGTKRNRGYGKIECKLYDEMMKEISFIKELEEICK